MALKLEGEELNTFGNDKQEQTYTVDEITDEFMLFENDGGKINIDMRNLDFENNEMEITIINNIGACRIIVDNNVKVVCEIENDMGTITNGNENGQEGLLTVRGINTLGSVSVRNVL